MVEGIGGTTEVFGVLLVVFFVEGGNLYFVVCPETVSPLRAHFDNSLVVVSLLCQKSSKVLSLNVKLVLLNLEKLGCLFEVIFAWFSLNYEFKCLCSTRNAFEYGNLIKPILGAWFWQEVVE